MNAGIVVRIALLLSIVAWRPAPAVAAPTAAEVDRDARELGERLVAPCCWRETLGSHSSPLATELRAEIRARLAAGEAPGGIEEDLVRRYGPKVRALPGSWDPRLVFGGIAFAAAGLGLVLVLFWVRRQRRSAPAPGPAVSQADRHHAERLDDELAELEV